MRKITLLLSLIFVATVAFAQNSNVRKAERALEDGELQEAKTLIDEAAKHEKTKDDGKTFYVQGSVYQAMLEENYSDELLKETVEAYEKVKELEKEGSNYYTLTDLKLQEIWGKFINEGSDNYNNKDFAASVESFKKALIVRPEDTTATLYAGIALQQTGDNQGAIDYYYRLIELDYHDKSIYESIISIEQIENKDYDKAIEVVRMAQEQFPNEDSFEKREISLLIEDERTAEAREKIMANIEKDPDNANLYFNLGYLYEELEQPEKAEEAYLKAIEIDPDYLDANYNYAVYNYNIAADMYTKAANMSLEEYQKTGKQLEEDAEVYLKKAQPYFEKSLELAPDEIQIINTLQTLYTRLGMKEKAQEMMEKADDLQNK